MSNNLRKGRHFVFYVKGLYAQSNNFLYDLRRLVGNYKNLLPEEVKDEHILKVVLEVVLSYSLESDNPKKAISEPIINLAMISRCGNVLGVVDYAQNFLDSLQEIVKDKHFPDLGEPDFRVLPKPR